MAEASRTLFVEVCTAADPGGELALNCSQDPYQDELLWIYLMNPRTWVLKGTAKGTMMAVIMRNPMSIRSLAPYHPKYQGWLILGVLPTQRRSMHHTKATESCLRTGSLLILATWPFFLIGLIGSPWDPSNPKDPN